MGQEHGMGFTVRRARTSDCGRIGEFVSRALPGKRTIVREDVLSHLGQAGLLLAESGTEPIGLLGWQVENLVARITDFLVVRPKQREAITRALLAMMEETACELQCEAVVLLIRGVPSPEMVEFWSSFGYERRKVAGLPQPWREAAGEVPLGTDGTVLLKQLRQERVLRPI